MFVVLGACALVALLLVIRSIVSARIRARWRARHRFDATGTVEGAGSISWGEGARAVLLLHGFGDSPQSLASVARALHEAGFAVRAPLLPGHGRTLDAWRESRATEWMRAAREAYTAIAGDGREVAVVGVSMGGAIACDLVADLAPGRAPKALVLVTPYLHLPFAARLLTALWPVWSLWRPWVPGNREASIHDPVARARSLGYGVATPRLLRELRTVVERGIRGSRRLRIPTLAIFSAHDYRIPVVAARAAFDRIGATEKSMHWVERSGHVVTADYDADEVARRTVEWIDRWLGSAT